MSNPERGSDPLRVLLVDDEPLVLHLLEDALTVRGFKVTTAAAGAEALRLGNERPPDVVLSDTNMPGMDGLELLAAFRADPDLAGVPFFLMSGNPDEEQRALAAGVKGVSSTSRSGVVPWAKRSGRRAVSDRAWDAV